MNSYDRTGRVMLKELKAIRMSRKETEITSNGWIIIEPDGELRKPSPNEKVPTINIDFVKGGVTKENGIPVKPFFDLRLRRRKI